MADNLTLFINLDLGWAHAADTGSGHGTRLHRRPDSYPEHAEIEYENRKTIDTCHRGKNEGERIPVTFGAFIRMHHLERLERRLVLTTLVCD